tara:strand:- start:202 stop:5553 length:5352 start_codon:yes stop_codon:yes gene_type:complete
MAEFKKKITPERMVYPNSVYPDLYDNNKTTTDIAIGTVGGVTTNSFVIGDFTVPDKNAFGDSKLVGAKLGLYINSITRQNSASGIPGLKAYKVPVNIGDREGGKASAGSLISLQNFAQICSYHTDDVAIAETFNGYVKPTEDSEELVQDVIIRKTEPYLTRTDGYEYGTRFGKERGLRSPIGKDKHFKRYGSTLGDGTEVYKIKHGKYGDQTWVSVRESKHWKRYNRESWVASHIGGLRHHVGTYNKIKYETTETIQRSNTEDNVQRANTDNTFFDAVSEATTFKSALDNINVGKVAYGDIAFSSSKSRTGGQSLHMHSVYPHRDTTLADIHYPKGTNDNTENQQTSFVTKQLPLPVHLYSHRGESDSTSGSAGSEHGRNKPLMNTISMCVYIESIAPMLERIGLATHSEGGVTEALRESTQRGRLNRSICVTFGEEKPIDGEKFYDYVKRHAPNATSASATGTSTGVGTSAKSFMGIAFFNDGGDYGYSTLGRHYTNETDPTGAQYTDVNFLLDAARGEVVVPTRNTNLRKAIESKWLNLDFQFHPDGSHTFCTMYDPKTGDVHNSTAGQTTTAGTRLHNIKNTSATGGGLWAMNDTTNFPRYMTVWVNNYQVIPGTFDSGEGRHETGLKVAASVDNDSGTGADSGTATNKLRVYASRERDSRSVFQGAASRTNSAFLNINTGDTLITRNNDDSANVSLVVEKRNTSTFTDGFPVYDISTNIDVKAGEKIYFDQSKFPDFNNTTPAPMETSLFIDNITLKNFNMTHSNATPSSVNKSPSRLKIPSTYRTSTPGYYYKFGDDAMNVKNNLADFPSYFCFGFDNISDFEGSRKYLLMNGFSVNGVNAELYQGLTEAVVDPEDSNSAVSSARIDSKRSCIRVGYTSFEDYGRQGALDSLQRTDDGATNPEGHISKISNPSDVFDNDTGSPDTLKRGLNVGDLGVDSAEFSVHNNDTHNVDGFTQKGFIQWNFDRRVTSLSGVTVSNNPLAATDVTLNVPTITGSSNTIAVNNFIKIGSEIMKVTAITDTDGDGNFTPAALTIVRAQDGTTAAEHASSAQVSLVALPEKRESIFTSARVLKVIDSNKIQVDNSEVFTFETNTEYILYIYDDSHASPTSGYPKTLQVATIEDDEISFTTRHGIDPETEFKFLISPKKYWLMVELHNFTDSPLDRRDLEQSSNSRSVVHEKTAVTNPNQSDRVVVINEALTATETVISFVQGENVAIKRGDVIQINDEKMLVTVVDSSSNPSTIGVVRGVFGSTATTHANQTVVFYAPRRYLPEKNYDSAILLTGLPDGSHSSLGTTFNETLYNDGEYINSWDLDPFVKADDTAIDLKDYGFGEFEEEDQSGGHLGHINLNIQNDVNTYKEIDISGVVKVDKVKDSDTFTVLVSPDDPNDSYKINVDTEDGTNPFYGIAMYEDVLPQITNFKIEPNIEDPFFVDYTWSCNDEDVWYGFLHVSDENVKDQYHGALMHIPLNDDAVDAQTVSAFAVKDKNGDLLTSSGFVDSVSSTAGFVPKHTIEGLAGNAITFDSNDVLNIGTASDDCFSTLGKEMSVVLHCINTSADFSANSGADQYILRKGQTSSNVSLDIFGQRIGSTTTGKIVVRLMSDGASTTKHVELTSSTVIEKDVPLNIIVTFDANLYRSNCKLFINGRLEDQSGDVLASHSAGNNTGWVHKTDLYSANAPLVIGAKHENATSSGWTGTIEEVVIYDRLIYPVDVKSGRFTFTKPLEELTAEASSTSKNYNARLFVKDYHNIRGSSKEDVAMTASISYRKAAFNLNGVAD